MPRMFMLVSIVLNVMNEEDHIGDTMDSLVIQEQPLEIVVVDASSKDHTRDIVQRYAEKYPFVHLFIKAGTRASVQIMEYLRLMGISWLSQVGTTW